VTNVFPPPPEVTNVSPPPDLTNVLPPPPNVTQVLPPRPKVLGSPAAAAAQPRVAVAPAAGNAAPPTAPPSRPLPSLSPLSRVSALPAAGIDRQLQHGAAALPPAPWSASLRAGTPAALASGGASDVQSPGQPNLPPAPRLPGLASNGTSAGFSLAFVVALIVLLSSLARRSASIRRIGSTAGRPRHFALLLERPG
jgi:hypothetical protein